MRKPGCRPDDLPPLTFQPSSEIDSKRSGPRTSSAVESGPAPDPIGEPARVGHLVDRVDVPGADVDGGCQVRRTCCATKSYPFESSIGATFDASSDMSSSVAIGSSGIERRRLRRQRLDRQQQRATAAPSRMRAAANQKTSPNTMYRCLPSLAAEPRIDTEDRAVVGVESKAEAIGPSSPLKSRSDRRNATLPAS